MERSFEKNGCPTLDFQPYFTPCVLLFLVKWGFSLSVIGFLTFFTTCLYLFFIYRGFCLSVVRFLALFYTLAYSCLWGFCLSVVGFLTLFYTLCFLVEGILSVSCGIFSPILHLMSSCPGDSASWSQDFQPYFTPCVSLFNVDGDSACWSRSWEFYNLCFLVKKILPVGSGIFSPILNLVFSWRDNSVCRQWDFQPYFKPCVFLSR